MKEIKKALAIVLVATTLLTVVPVDVVAAQEISAANVEATLENVEQIQPTEVMEYTEGIENTEVIENNSEIEEAESIEDAGGKEDAGRIENTEDAESTEEVENTEKAESTEVTVGNVGTESTEGVEETETEEEYLIQYLMVKQSNVDLGTKQQLVLGVGCDKVIYDAALSYYNQSTGEFHQQYYSEVRDGAILFEILFDNINQTGTYQLDAITFKVDEETYTESFAEAGIEAVFGVNQEVAAEPDAMIDDGTTEDIEVDVDVVIIDENGNTTSETTLEEAIDNARASQVSTYGLNRSSDIVVVLDPGHDDTHAGAQANGLGEEDLNIKIAAYCKEELEKYRGVVVYLTRALDGSCPYPGTTSGVCNQNRVAFAQNVGASVYVSLHINSAANTSANGAMVFYPNANYNSWVSNVGQGLAQQIQNQLVALGLYDRGITIRDAQQDKYSDGSAADYYGVIRNGKLAGIPAIIVEHAFISNTGDVNNFLVSDEKLKALGVADATAIASYYGLSKENIAVTAGITQISNLNNATGTATMSVSNVDPFEKINKVSFAVWSKSDQSDLVWYDATTDGTGTYQAMLNISRHQYNIGKYYVDTYARDIYGESHYLGGSTCSFGISASQISVIEDSRQIQYTATIKGLEVPGGIKSVKYAVWSAIGGTDDLHWYTAQFTASGEYYSEIPILNHKTSGLYYVDAYAVRMDDTIQYITGTTFQVEEMTAGSVEIQNVDNEAGKFEVVVDGLNSASGIWQIEVPVWTKSDLSDIFWYKASRQSDGSYRAYINISNHEFAYTKYYTDVYGVAENGVRSYLGGSTIVFSPLPAIVIAEENENELEYAINITQLRMAGVEKHVKVAVWSATNGMDDLIWYDAEPTALSDWRVNIPISNHKTAGIYYADAYVIDRGGNSSYIGGTKFSVSDCSITSIQISNKDEGAGTFDVILDGITWKSGVNTVQVPVWSKADLTDLHWYIAMKQADGSYKVTVNIANHGYQYDTYNVDVYAVSNSAIRRYLGGTQVTMRTPIASVNVAGNANESTYTAMINNAELAGGIRSISFAVWSKTGGQDDLEWYEATKLSEGKWSGNISIQNHKTSGLYYVDVYALNSSGNSVYIGGTTFDVGGVDITGIIVCDKNEGTGKFNVVVNGITTPSGINTVQIPVWSKSDLSDIYWYTAIRQSDGSYIAKVDIANHNYNYGKYFADVYVITRNGIRQYVGGRTTTLSVPTISISATANTTQTGYTLTASNVGIQGGVAAVQFAVWSEADGQDDLQWYSAANTSAGIWTANAVISNHKTAGKYYADVYASAAGGRSVYLGGITFQVEEPSVTGVSLVNYNEADGTFGVQAIGVQSTAGIASVKVAVWSSGNHSDLVWYDAAQVSSGTYQIGADIRNHQNNTGKYYADVYVTDNNGIRIYAGGVTCTIVNVTNVLHPLMGSTSVTVTQMAKYFCANSTYPIYYMNTEAPTIEAFCKIYIEECQAEGVKAEVAFCQAMKETGFLKFGGNVSIAQYNFAGMGSTGAGVAGEYYSDIRTGIRAQVQHLKAYGCSEPLNQECVDSRFKYVKRNTAPYIEWLGIQENPYGKGWATAKNYGYHIVNMVNTLKTY